MDYFRSPKERYHLCTREVVINRLMLPNPLQAYDPPTKHNCSYRAWDLTILPDTLIVSVAGSPTLFIFPMGKRPHGRPPIAGGYADIEVTLPYSPDLLLATGWFKPLGKLTVAQQAILKGDKPPTGRRKWERRKSPLKGSTVE